jgi:hypothetical protein
VYLYDMASNKQQRETEARNAQYAATLQTVSHIENRRGQQVAIIVREHDARFLALMIDECRTNVFFRAQVAESQADAERVACSFGWGYRVAA